MTRAQQHATQQLLVTRQQLTDSLDGCDAFCMLSYYARATVHSQLRYPDLAIMDSYKALLLAEEVLDDSAEYHDQALESLSTALDDAAVDTVGAATRWGTRQFSPFLPPEVASFFSRPLSVPASNHTTEQGVSYLAELILREAQSRTADILASLNCFRSAYTMINNAIKAAEGSPHERHVEQRRKIVSAIATYYTSKNESFNAEEFNVDDLPDRGLVRREVYPWNSHELDRMSDKGLDFLNEEMTKVAPKLHVQVVQLPDLANPGNPSRISKQLGVFAKEHIAAGEQVLCERSLLTANMREHEPLCDACGSELPELDAQPKPGDSHGPVPCAECCDVAFCSESCQEAAQDGYHRSVCGMDIESVGKNVPAAKAADALYVQLMFRAMAMSLAQDVHPLDLKEVKFIWGDFQTGDSLESMASKPFTLPYDFDSQVLQPLHLLEQLDISIFEPPHQLAETWVYNTLLAKFRGTASARISPRDGRPEVAAVHPLWCLANHSCDPNVQWEWSGLIRFSARETRIEWTKERDGVLVEKRPGRRAGIDKSQEILNHYVDIELPVKDRREWGEGALGGSCQCERCKWEADEATLSLEGLHIR